MKDRKFEQEVTNYRGAQSKAHDIAGATAQAKASIAAEGYPDAAKDADALGMLALKAYRAACGEDPNLDQAWPHLPETIRKAWIAVAAAVKAHR